MIEEEKKTERKRKRFAARLKTSKGVICTDVPGPNVVLCNAGQATGLEKDAVFKLIMENRLAIPLPKFMSLKGESHSFLVFDVTASAVQFLNMFNGKVIEDDHGTPIYINFVEKVPNTEKVYPYWNPNGLYIINDFINVDEEEAFLKLFDWSPETNNLKNRQVKHYGFEFRYGSNDVDLSNALTDKIPKECDVLWERLKEHGYNVGVPDQMTVNKYGPGQGIPSHVDKHSPFGDTILSLSLGSDVVMDWRHHSGKYVPILIQTRSLLVMQGEARYDWQHGIQPRSWDPIIQLSTSDNSEDEIKVVTSDTTPRGTRISLTFRWTRGGPCQCSYKTLCDSAQKISADNLNDNLANNLEELHVHQVYEQIAGHFSTTRHKPWPKVVQFMEEVPPGCVVLDLGCGNGKNILHRNDIVQIAGERSWSLLMTCQEHLGRAGGAGRAGGTDAVRLDALHVPLRDVSADVVICIAVIHHFSSPVRRLQAISNIHRILRTGGRALITVWAKDQTKSNYLCKNKLNQTDIETETQVTVGGVSLPVHENRTQFKHQDLLVPWKLRKVTENKLSSAPENTLLRYYHVFEENELDELCKQAHFEIEKSYYEEGNWCVECKKK